MTNLQHIQLNTKSISSKNLDFVFKYAVFKMKVKNDHRNKFSNLSNWKEEMNVSEKAFQFIV